MVLGDDVTGKVFCLLVITANMIFLLWLYAKNKEKNKKDAVKVLVLAGILGLIICITEDNSQVLTKEGTLLKGEAGKDSKSYELQLNAEGVLEDYDYTVEVEARRLQGKKLEQLFASAAAEAEETFLGENQSLDCIDRDVSLPKKLQDGQIRAAWEFDKKELIDAEGQLQTEQLEETGALVMVSLDMTYDDEVRNHTFGCYVYPKRLSSSEQLLSDLQDYFEKEQESGKNEKFLKLPLQLNGYILSWSQQSENTYQIILLIGMAAAAAVYIQQAMKDKRKEEERKNQLLKQYPDMVSKISLLLGSGMTLSAAWERIVLNYQRQLEHHQTETSEVYEQMLVSYREMQDGVGELKVYERFGERCATPQYRKLSMLIVQNLRKGSSGLRQMLEKEVADAFALRKNLAKKAGEEAGTKILLPMMLMLCIVMVIILVPAFLTFQL